MANRKHGNDIYIVVVNDKRIEGVNNVRETIFNHFDH